MLLFTTVSKTKQISRTFRVEGSMQDQRQSCMSRKLGKEKVLLVFDFVCFSGRHFTLLEFAKKDILKRIFLVSTLMTYIFAPCIKNLVTYFAISVYFDFLQLYMNHSKNRKDQEVPASGANLSCVTPCIRSFDSPCTALMRVVLKYIICRQPSFAKIC